MPANITSEAPVSSLLFLSDGSLAGNCADNTVRVWDLASGQVKRTVTREKGPSELAAKDTLLSVSAGNEVKVWDLATGSAVRQHAGPPKTAVQGAAISADRRTLALASEGKYSEDTVHLYAADGTLKHSAPAGIGGTATMALSADGALFASASYDTDMRAWNARNGELLVRVTELPLATFDMAFSPDSRWLAAGGADRMVHLFDTKTWKIARQLKGQNEMVSCLAFSPDGRRLLTGGFNDITVKHPVQILLWDLASGAVAKRFEMPRQVRSVAYAPDGKWAAATAGDKQVTLLAL